MADPAIIDWIDDWCLTPTLALFQQYPSCEQILYKNVFPAIDLADYQRDR